MTQPGTEAVVDERAHLVVVDPQRIFADPDSDWASPFFDEAFENMRRLAQRFSGRTTVTRWLPTADRSGSWGDYFEAWPFADVPAEDPLYDLVEGAAELTALPLIDAPTFGKWTQQLIDRLGPAPTVVLVGVSTDCCVISTALAAADAGARVVVVADACAHSTQEDGDAALRVMGLYAPQIVLTTTEDLLG